MSGGKFINKSYVGTIDALTKGTVTKVQNANYVFNDKPQSFVIVGIIRIKKLLHLMKEQDQNMLLLVNKVL